MTSTYAYNNSLYVNVTNRCPNCCDFCVRTQADGFYSDDLWLEREPTVEEIVDSILSSDVTKYDSLVFCGYGEPTERLSDIIAVSKEIKRLFPSLHIRLNTNGQSDLINSRPTASEMEGVFDSVSVSLNAPTREAYDAVCHSKFGAGAFDAVIEFAVSAKKYIPNVVFSAVKGSIPDTDLEKCGIIAQNAGIPLRIRDYIKNS